MQVAVEFLPIYIKSPTFVLSTGIVVAAITTTIRAADRCACLLAKIALYATGAIHGRQDILPFPFRDFDFWAILSTIGVAAEQKEVRWGLSQVLN